jgi:hypothetical protein
LFNLQMTHEERRYKAINWPLQPSWRIQFLPDHLPGQFCQPENNMHSLIGVPHEENKCRS